MTPVANNKAQRAYAWLREKIRTRDFEPGHRLVLSTIAQELEVSVVPVREAIRQLEAEGLVTYEPNVGARVTTLNRDVYFQTMETIAVLEGYATGMSAPLLSETDLQAAEGINAQMQELLNNFDPVEFTRLNQEFHKVLFQHCPNPRLLNLLYEEWEHLDYFRVSTFRYIPERATQSVAEHDRLIQLIRAKADTSYIEKEARNHRLSTLENYRQQTAQTQKLQSVNV